jgi:CRISPR-associated endonuclease Cas3-HD
MSVQLYSAPEEYYLNHISRCKEKFELIFPVFYSTIVRTFDSSISQDTLKDSFVKMILFHDLGKLTKRWQENVGTNKKLPSHAPIGAAYLYKKFQDEKISEDVICAISFAVAIHHTDKGLLGDNIEKPDVQAITDGIADYNGNIDWDSKTDKLDSNYFPEEVRNLKLTDLKEMARGLRRWAKGCGLLKQHQRRLQASLAHHILKLCDISAAKERKEYQKKDDKDYYGGWLMVENIKKYVDNLQIRLLAKKIKEIFNPQKIILFGSYAYGIPKKGSDIDLLVIMDTDIPVRQQAFFIRKELRSSIPIDIIVRTPAQIEERIRMGDFFIKQIIQKGIYL